MPLKLSADLELRVISIAADGMDAMRLSDGAHDRTRPIQGGLDTSPNVSVLCGEGEDVAIEEIMGERPPNACPPAFGRGTASAPASGRTGWPSWPPPPATARPR